MLKIVVASDTHGRNDILNILERKYRDAQLFVHCGDLEDDPRRYPAWIVVKGNNDYWGQFRDDVCISAGSHRIYVVHSHRVSYSNRSKNLARIAKEKHCDMVFFGHTHRVMAEWLDGVFMLNPGSVWLPRGGYSGSYAIVTIDGDKIDAKILFQEDWDFDY